MKSTQKMRTLSVLALAIYLVAGCSLISEKGQEPTLEQTANQPRLFEQLVAKDVVSVIMQIGRLAPNTTILGTSDENLQQGAFAEALKGEFRAAGYAIRSTGAGAQTIPVSYQLDTLDSDEASVTSQTVTVTFGDIAVRRSYSEDSQGKVSPVGSMQVRGVDATGLRLVNDIFSLPASGKEDPDKIPEAPPAPENTSKQLASVDTSPLPLSPEQSVESNQAKSNPSSSVVTTTDRPLLELVAPAVSTATPQSLGAIAVLSHDNTQNVRDLQRSNFESMFSDMGIVDEEILTFANDSTRMGDANKARLQDLLKSFDPGSDIFSVVGCSLGNTNHAGGQEELARGRAMRVQEELMYSGVPESKILAEGCWAEEAFDERMPRRGVVVTLKRPIS